MSQATYSVDKAKKEDTEIHFETQTDRKWEGWVYEGHSHIKTVICSNESWTNKDFQLTNQLLCVFDRLLIDCTNSSEDERVKRAVDSDPSLPVQPQQPQLAKPVQL